MATRFRNLRSKLGPPRFTSEGEAGLIGYALDLVADAYIQRVYEGLLARFPSTAPSDALPLLGRDRRVRRGRNESDASYRARLLRWLDDRRAWGTPFAMLQKLAEYMGDGHGVSMRLVTDRGSWYSRDANGAESYVLDAGNWDWDGSPATEWARFWLIIYPGTLWTPTPAWGTVGTTWGSTPFSWGSTATGDEVASIRAIVDEWKMAGSRCVSIIIAFDPASFDPASLPGAPNMPDGTWHQPSKNVAGTQVPNRLGTAIYWNGE